MSSKKSSSRLKQLAKMIPSDNDVVSVISSLLSQDTPFADYATAVISVSLLERCIKNAMLGRFVDLSTDEESRLFVGEEAPLGSFSARIKVGYAIYLFGPKTRDELETIRAIRNFFAHSHSPVSFADKDVNAECMKLAERKHLFARFDGKKLPGGPRVRFARACVGISQQVLSGVAVRSMKWNPGWMGGKAPSQAP